jgi:hypothetical protein
VRRDAPSDHSQTCLFECSIGVNAARNVPQGNERFNGLLTWIVSRMRSKTETAAVTGGNCKVAMRSLANAVVVIAACKGSISSFFMRAKLSGMMMN